MEAGLVTIALVLTMIKKSSSKKTMKKNSSKQPDLRPVPMKRGRKQYEIAEAKRRGYEFISENVLATPEKEHPRIFLRERSAVSAAFRKFMGKRFPEINAQTDCSSVSAGKKGARTRRECAHRCNRGRDCTNSKMTTKHSERIEVYNSGIGLGLRTQNQIGERQPVIEVTGAISTKDAFVRQYAKWKKGKKDTSFFIQLCFGLIIDLTTHSNISRFVNHSCNPSCKLQRYETNGRIILVLETLRTLKKGEAITIDYSKMKYGSDVIGKANDPIICKCGENNCRGFILSAKKIKELGLTAASIKSGSRKQKVVQKRTKRTKKVVVTKKKKATSPVPGAGRTRRFAAPTTPNVPEVSNGSDSRPDSSFDLQINSTDDVVRDGSNGNVVQPTVPIALPASSGITASQSPSTSTARASPEPAMDGMAREPIEDPAPSSHSNSPSPTTSRPPADDDDELSGDPSDAARSTSDITDGNALIESIEETAEVSNSSGSGAAVPTEVPSTSTGSASPSIQENRPSAKRKSIASRFDEALEIDTDLSDGESNPKKRREDPPETPSHPHLSEVPIRFNEIASSFPVLPRNVSHGPSSSSQSPYQPSPNGNGFEEGAHSSPSSPLADHYVEDNALEEPSTSSSPTSGHEDPMDVPEDALKRMVATFLPPSKPHDTAISAGPLPLIYDAVLDDAVLAPNAILPASQPHALPLPIVEEAPNMSGIEEAKVSVTSSTSHSPSTQNSSADADHMETDDISEEQPIDRASLPAAHTTGGAEFAAAHDADMSEGDVNMSEDEDDPNYGGYFDYMEDDYDPDENSFNENKKNLDTAIPHGSLPLIDNVQCEVIVVDAVRSNVASITPAPQLHAPPVPIVDATRCTMSGMHESTGKKQSIVGASLHQATLSGGLDEMDTSEDDEDERDEEDETHGFMALAPLHDQSDPERDLLVSDHPVDPAEAIAQAHFYEDEYEVSTSIYPEWSDADRTEFAPSMQEIMKAIGMEENPTGDEIEMMDQEEPLDELLAAQEESIVDASLAQGDDEHIEKRDEEDEVPPITFPQLSDAPARQLEDDDVNMEDVEDTGMKEDPADDGEESMELEEPSDEPLAAQAGCNDPARVASDWRNLINDTVDLMKNLADDADKSITIKIAKTKRCWTTNKFALETETGMVLVTQEVIATTTLLLGLLTKELDANFELDIYELKAQTDGVRAWYLKLRDAMNQFDAQVSAPLRSRKNATIEKPYEAFREIRRITDDMTVKMKPWLRACNVIVNTTHGAVPLEDPTEDSDSLDDDEEESDDCMEFKLPANERQKASYPPLVHEFVKLGKKLASLRKFKILERNLRSRGLKAMSRYVQEIKNEIMELFSKFRQTITDLPHVHDAAQNDRGAIARLRLRTKAVISCVDKLSSAMKNFSMKVSSPFYSLEDDDSSMEQGIRDIVWALLQCKKIEKELKSSLEPWKDHCKRMTKKHAKTTTAPAVDEKVLVVADVDPEAGSGRYNDSMRRSAGNSANEQQSRPNPPLSVHQTPATKKSPVSNTNRVSNSKGLTDFDPMEGSSNGLLPVQSHLRNGLVGGATSTIHEHSNSGQREMEDLNMHYAKAKKFIEHPEFRELNYDLDKIEINKIEQCLHSKNRSPENIFMVMNVKEKMAEANRGITDPILSIPKLTSSILDHGSIMEPLKTFNRLSAVLLEIYGRLDGVVNEFLVQGKKPLPARNTDTQQGALKLAFNNITNVENELTSMLIPWKDVCKEIVKIINHIRTGNSLKRN